MSTPVSSPLNLQPTRTILLAVAWGAGDNGVDAILYDEAKLPAVVLQRIKTMQGENDYNYVLFGDIPNDASSLHDARDALIEAATIRCDLSNGIPDGYKVVLVAGFVCR
jgi:hypothetical protein